MTLHPDYAIKALESLAGILAPTSTATVGMQLEAAKEILKYGEHFGITPTFPSKPEKIAPKEIPLKEIAA